MQLWSPDGVRQERCDWRDRELSLRHRTWGFNCPAVDLDFLVVEYNLGKPVAFVEYKRHNARQPDVRHPTYRALIRTADGHHELSAAGIWTHEPLPFLIGFYWPEIWAFKVSPVNAMAKQHFREGEVLTEYDFVRRLYRMRRLVLAAELEGRLLRKLPGGVAA